MPRSALRYVDPIPELKQRVAELTLRALARRNAFFAGHDIGTDDRRVHDLRAGRLKRFSLETLIRFATKAGVQLDLVERPTTSKRTF